MELIELPIIHFN